MQTFAQWLKNHTCTTEELWKIQNMLGSCTGWNSNLYEEAKEAWEKSRTIHEWRRCGCNEELRVFCETHAREMCGFL